MSTRPYCSGTSGNSPREYDSPKGTQNGKSLLESTGYQRGSNPVNTRTGQKDRRYDYRLRDRGERKKRQSQRTVGTSDSRRARVSGELDAGSKRQEPCGPYQLGNKCGERSTQLSISLQNNTESAMQVRKRLRVGLRRISSLDCRKKNVRPTGRRAIRERSVWTSKKGTQPGEPCTESSGTGRGTAGKN